MSVATRLSKSWAIPKFDIYDPSLVFHAPLWRPDMVARGGAIKDGTGTMDVTPQALAVGANTITVTAAGTLIVYMPEGGTVASGTMTVSGSPVTVSAGIATTITTTGATGNITVTSSNIIRSKDKSNLALTITGATKVLKGRNLDGDDFISVTSPFAAGATFTILTWFMQSARQDTRVVMVNLEPGSADTQGIGFGINTSDQLRVVNDGVAWGDGTFSPVLGQYYMVMMTRSGTTTNLYKDGESAVISTLTNTQQDSGTKLHIGKGQIADGTNNYFLKGVEGEVWGYNRVLSAWEFQQRWQTTKWRF